MMDGGGGRTEDGRRREEGGGRKGGDVGCTGLAANRRVVCDGV
jgi:hypothetical protein